jgi:hypothetical protein
MIVMRLGPSAATNASARRICGNDSVTSTTVMITVSTRPPRNPERSPRVTPTRRLTTTAETPTRREIRAPWMIRLKTSRPTWSVPRG